jgi:hypothetical protein
MDARRRKARALRLRHPQSLVGLRQRPNQGNVCSTIQRLGRTRKPAAQSDRLTISTLTRPRTFLTAGAIGIELQQEQERAASWQSVTERKSMHGGGR